MPSLPPQNAIWFFMGWMGRFGRNGCPPNCLSTCGGVLYRFFRNTTKSASLKVCLNPVLLMRCSTCKLACRSEGFSQWVTSVYENSPNDSPHRWINSLGGSHFGLLAIPAYDNQRAAPPMPARQEMSGFKWKRAHFEWTEYSILKIDLTQHPQYQFSKTRNTIPLKPAKIG